MTLMMVTLLDVIPQTIGTWPTLTATCPPDQVEVGVVGEVVLQVFQEQWLVTGLQSHLAMGWAHFVLLKGATSSPREGGEGVVVQPWAD